MNLGDLARYQYSILPRARTSVRPNRPGTLACIALDDRVRTLLSLDGMPQAVLISSDASGDHM